MWCCMSSSRSSLLAFSPNIIIVHIEPVRRPRATSAPRLHLCIVMYVATTVGRMRNNNNKSIAPTDGRTDGATASGSVAGWASRACRYCNRNARNTGVPVRRSRGVEKWTVSVDIARMYRHSACKILFGQYVSSFRLTGF